MLHGDVYHNHDQHPDTCHAEELLAVSGEGPVPNPCAAQVDHQTELGVRFVVVPVEIPEEVPAVELVEVPVVDAALTDCKTAAALVRESVFPVNANPVPN